ncbi:hypothetical protein [Streptomyces sp. MUM 178J]|uniref:hypothetical protein n=1 Tax=Streptomyces sp. MUM 178J TaxID=2791991 RepID=UPI0027E2E414|nr:hypothetical protein [Streptomyces sp. MUM 178J]WRQ78578.1 hypothetical protein I3F59_003825 [Streptomyces sp. MUM 178J]
MSTEPHRPPARPVSRIDSLLPPDPRAPLPEAAGPSGSIRPSPPGDVPAQRAQRAQHSQHSQRPADARTPDGAATGRQPDPSAAPGAGAARPEPSRRPDGPANTPAAATPPPGKTTGASAAGTSRPAPAAASAPAASASAAPAPTRPPGDARPAPHAGAGDIPDSDVTTRLRPLGAPRTAQTPDAPPRSAAPAPVTPPAPPGHMPVGAVDLSPRPGATPRAAHQGAQYHLWAPPEHPAEMTTRLRPIRPRRPGRTAAAVVCAVLGIGLLGGAAAGAWLIGDANADPAARSGYAQARDLWHSVPVDTLFPRTLDGGRSGPGGADRAWKRIAVAPDSGCAEALDPLLDQTLRTVGCSRLVRATYTDTTATSVITVGLVFTEADEQGMRALKARFAREGLGERTDLMPRALSAAGTVAAGFGDPQRASWTVNVLTDAPVVVYAVSGFADGRAVDNPEPAAEATAEGATSAPAQSGLGHEAAGVAEAVERALRATVRPSAEDRT